MSPIAGDYFYKTNMDKHKGVPQQQPLLKAIRPENDASWRAPFFNSVTIFGSGSNSKNDNDNNAPPVAVRATPSLQNLRVLTTALGVVSASPNDLNDSKDDNNRGGGILKDWYERGQADAYDMLNTL